jgi:hypothetical protein
MQNDKAKLKEIIFYLLDALEEEHYGLKDIYIAEVKERYGIDICRMMC